MWKKSVIFSACDKILKISKFIYFFFYLLQFCPHFEEFCFETEQQIFVQQHAFNHIFFFFKVLAIFALEYQDFMGLVKLIELELRRTMLTHIAKNQNHRPKEKKNALIAPISSQRDRRKI